MVGREELRKDTVEELDLARATNELVVDHRAWVHLILNALEQERMLADLAELHELIAETFETAGLPPRGVSSRTRGVSVHQVANTYTVSLLLDNGLREGAKVRVSFLE